MNPQKNNMGGQAFFGYVLLASKGDSSGRLAHVCGIYEKHSRGHVFYLIECGQKFPSCLKNHRRADIYHLTGDDHACCVVASVLVAQAQNNGGLGHES